MAQAMTDEGRDAVSFLRVGAAACPARSNSIRKNKCGLASLLEGGGTPTGVPEGVSYPKK